MIRKFAVLAGAMSCASLPAWAQTAPQAQSPAQSPAAQSSSPALDDAHRFGVRETVRDISLSPDGTHFVALLSGKGTTMTLATGPIDGSTAPRAIANADGNPERITGCDWANETRLVCSLYTIDGRGADAMTFTRMIVINADGTGMKLLTARPGVNAHEIMQRGGQVIDWFGDAKGSTILMTRQFVSDTMTGSRLGEQQRGYGVERVDPVSLRRNVAEAPNPDAESFITDGLGNVRIVGMRGDDSIGYEKSRVRYLYRLPGKRDWQLLSTITDNAQSSKGFTPIAVDPTLNVAYGFDTQDGRAALFKIALDGSMKRELVFARPDVDVDGLIRIGRQKRVVGVTFVTDRRQTAFFDPQLKKLSAALSRAMPKLPLISFIDASADENRLLLWAGSDVDPGHYYVFDKTTRHLDQLLDVRPELAGATLSPVKSITYTAADGTQVPAYLTLPQGSTGKGIPAIVMPHGGPGARDEWGFDWLSQFFAARGYAVLQPNFRGSTGYGEAWFVDNGFKSWRTAVGDVDDAGRWLIAQGIAAPDHLAIVGWSYGGYAALQSQVLDPDLFKAVVAIAPVTDLETLRQESSRFTNFVLVDAFIGTGPHVREGSPARNAARFKAPVLMFHGALDQNVGIGESRMMLAALTAAGKPAELVEYKDLDHQIDDSVSRTEMLEKADAFLRKAMKLP